MTKLHGNNCIEQHVAYISLLQDTQGRTAMYALFQSLNVVLEALHLCLHKVQMTVHNILSQICSMVRAGTEVSFPLIVALHCDRL